MKSIDDEPDPQARTLIRLFPDEVGDLGALSRIHDYKVRFSWHDDHTVDIIDPPAWAVTWLESRRGQSLTELEPWMCLYCQDFFGVDDEDRIPVCDMCRKGRFGFDPGSRVKHKRLIDLGGGTISIFQPDLRRGVVYVRWDTIPPGIVGSGRSFIGLPCPANTLGHDWRTLRPVKEGSHDQ